VLTNGTITVGTPWPMDSATVLRAWLSAIPAASLFMMLNVAGATISAAAMGNNRGRPRSPVLVGSGPVADNSFKCSKVKEVDSR
jgi:hypothetical protein